MNKLVLLLVSVSSVFLFLFFVGQAGFLHSKYLMIRSSQPTDVKILLAGDVMLGRTVTTKSLDEMGNSDYPFLKISSLLNSSKIFFLNLETPVVENCPRKRDGMVFCAPPEMLSGLRNLNTNVVVNLANNHTLNYGKSGYEETKLHLTESGISYVGYSDFYSTEVGGTSFGFLGFNYLDYKPKEADLKLIENYSKQVDVLVVGVHWGVEYRSKANDFQKEWGRRFVESGADVVSGHHPHWVQDTEYVNGVPVYYSLGNLVFDQMWSEETKKGVVVELTFNDGKIVGEKFIETYIREWAKPEIVESSN